MVSQMASYGRYEMDVEIVVDIFCPTTKGSMVLVERSERIFLADDKRLIVIVALDISSLEIAMA